MFDGIDLQFGLYIIFLSIIFISKGIMVNFYLAIIVSALFFWLKTLKEKYLLELWNFIYFNFSLNFFIGSYSKQNLFFVDEIFLCMAIPGYDLIRVSLQRLSKGKHMFSPDNEHIHHFLFSKLGTIKANFLVQIAIFAPIIIYYYYKDFLFH